jgi:predicted AAA+ superfamily ATPase
MKRYLEPQIRSDLNEKMVFVAGPRQVGKTTLALQILGKKNGYLNWDVPLDRERILKRELPEVGLWVFDEIHKYRSWRNYLKGLYDSPATRRPILVTGSARLDYYRFGGDSLQGRYHRLRLHPLSAGELGIDSPEDFQQLLTLGGFPEPFLGGSQRKAKRWSREYRSILVREEVTGLEQVQDLGNLELLMLRLPELVGSPLSINAVREDLQVSHKTAARWLMVFERLMAIFRLSPFGAPALRAVKKEQKHYHFDWSVVPDPARRFENMIASHLLKWVHFEADVSGRDLELHYFRDIDGREVDFVVMEDRRPCAFVECKWSDADISKGLKYLKARFRECPAFQVTAVGKKDYISADGIRVMPAVAYLKTLI